MADIPEHLLRRSAEARAKATGRPVEEILAEMKGEAAPPEPPEQVPVSSEVVDINRPSEVRGIPDHLLERSRRAKEAAAAGEDTEPGMSAQPAAQSTAEPAPEPADAQPVPEPGAVEPEPESPPPERAPAPAAVEEEEPAEVAGIPAHILERSRRARAQAAGEEEPPPAPAAEPPPAEEPPAPAAEPVPAAAPAAAAAAGQPAPAAAAEEPLPDIPGVPAHILERSRQARAKAEGRDVAPAPAAAAPAAPQAGAAPAPAAAAPRPAAPAPAAIPEGVRPQRLLTVVKARAIQQVKTEPTDKVNVWPHLLAIEFVALLAVTSALVVFSVFVDAPLLELANFNAQPNPSKAPWYFLGLQELLSYFDPQIAGVLIPGLGLAGLAFIPYIDRNPSTRPSDRKLAIMIFTFYLMAAAVLTIFGSFFRGPGFNFTFPWQDGIFFDF